MLEFVRTKWFGARLADCSARMPSASIAELTMLCNFAPPCCSHIALCDGSCHDAQADMTASMAQEPSLSAGNDST